METFYMVFVEGRAGPTRKHETTQEAQKEAERLILQEGKEAYILQAIWHGKANLVVWEGMYSPDTEVRFL